MIVVTTPTGRIGRHVLDRLVSAGERVRVIVRDSARLNPSLLGKIEVIEGSSNDSTTLRNALDEAESLFWCIPENHRLHNVNDYYGGFNRPLLAVVDETSLKRVVFVSSGGRGRAVNAGPISALHAIEEQLEGTPVALRSLRCGMFMENILSQIDLIRNRGVFSLPISGDLKLPTCAVRDIAETATRLLVDRTWEGHGGVAVHGPAHLSLNEMARVMSSVLERDVRFHEAEPAAFRASLVEHGLSPAFADCFIDMFAEISQGIYDAEPRTDESTTPTTFENWCRDVLVN